MMDNELYHYGVLGMKWGVRNSETKARYSREKYDKAKNKYLDNKSKIEKLRNKNKKLAFTKSKRDTRLARSNYRLSRFERKATRRFFRSPASEYKLEKEQSKNIKLKRDVFRVDYLINKNKKKIIKLNKKNEKLFRKYGGFVDSKIKNIKLEDIGPKKNSVNLKPEKHAENLVNEARKKVEAKGLNKLNRMNKRSYKMESKQDKLRSKIKKIEDKRVKMIWDYKNHPIYGDTIQEHK